jgi:acyl-CoA thioester hydrolase
VGRALGYAPVMQAFPVVIPIPVQWGDMDALGHVNNTVYFRWFESARIALFDAAGLDLRGIPPVVGPILAQTTCVFRQPVTYPANIVVGARVPRIGRTSFVMEYAAALDTAPDEPVATGEGVIVLVDYRTGAKVPVEGALRQKLEELAGGE